MKTHGTTWLAVVLALGVVSAGRASAETDAFGLGTGRSGALSVSTAGKVVNSYAKVTAAVAVGDVNVTVASTAAFSAGDLVMVLQTTGYPAPVSGDAGPFNLSTSAVGQWELGRVQQVGSGTLTLTAPVVHAYAVNVTQVIRIPEYTSVTVDTGASIAAQPWDGAIGGVVAFLVTGSVTNNGAIQADAVGFQGGRYVAAGSAQLNCSQLDQAAPDGAQKGEGVANTRFASLATGRGNVANGAGGGICNASGGGGGGNRGAGGQGGKSNDGNNVGGQGGAVLTFSALDHLLPGGGGGAGQGSYAAATANGGAGGGIVFVRAGSLSGMGTVSANGGAGKDGTYHPGGGSRGQPVGAGGGGAGGTVYLRLIGAAACGGVSANGGAGGNVTNSSTAAEYAGPGGGGAGGSVLLQTSSASASCPISVGFGSAGTLPGGTNTNAAQPGSLGISVTLNPPVPVVTAPVAGSIVTSTRRPVISGTLAGAPSGSTVAISVDGFAYAQVTLDSFGNWSFTPTADFTRGAHWVQAATVYMGLQGQQSAATAFIVTWTPASPVVTAPANGAVLNTRTVTLSGTAEPGTTVAVQLSGSRVGSVSVPGMSTTSGLWSIPVPTALQDDSYTVTATATDAWQNASPASSGVVFTVDATAPAAPTLTAPALWGPGTVTVSGTAEANSTVTVSLRRINTSTFTVVGTAVANASGSWGPVTVQTPSPDDAYKIRAYATDLAGNAGPNCIAQDFTVDTTAPGAPAVTVPANGVFTSNPKPVISGTAEASSHVSVYIDSSQTVGSVDADSSGNWSFTPPSSLSDGVHAVAARATDAAGNTGLYSSLSTFTVDTNPPVIQAPADNAALRSPVFTGSSLPGSAVTLTATPSQGAAVIQGNIPADAISGAWSYTPNPALADGAWTVTVQARDALSHVGASSATVHITVKTRLATAPAITFPLDGDVVHDTAPTFTGTAESGDSITVSVDGVVMGTTVASNGAWSFASAWPLAEGSHPVQVQAADAAGNTATSATNSFTVSQVPPVITSPANLSFLKTASVIVSGRAPAGYTVRVYLSQGGLSASNQCSLGAPVGSVLTATAGSGGTWSVTATGLADGFYAVRATAAQGSNLPSVYSDALCFTVDTASPASPGIVSPTAGAHVNTARPVITGTSEAYATVNLSIDQAPAGSTQADAQGQWSFVPAALSEGTHAIQAEATDRAGNTGPLSGSVQFTVQVTPPAAPAFTSPAAGAFVSTQRPLLAGTAPLNTTVTLYVDSSAVTATVGVDSAGAWTFAPASDLADGSHAVTARATDAAGNTSALGELRIFTVNTGAPVIQQPTSGSITRAVTFSGVALPHSTVTLTVSGNSASQVMFTVSAGSGAWTFTPPAALAEGVYTVTAQAVDEEGNTGAVSAAVSFTVKTSIGSRPQVTTPAPSTLMKDPSPSFAGTGQPGDPVSVLVDGLPFGKVTTSSQGSWTLAPSATDPWRLADGTHKVQAVETDAAGNTASSDEVTFTVKVDATLIDTPTPFAFTNQTGPGFTGKARPGSSVVVSIFDGPGSSGTCTLVGNPRTQLPAVTADAAGNWAVAASGLSQGFYAIRASATYGNDPSTRDSEPVCFTVKLTLPPSPIIKGPVDGAFLSTTQPFISGTAEPFASVQVSIDGVLAGTAPQADSYGNWSFLVPDKLAEGAHQVVARAFDRAGNASINNSAPSTFTVKTTPPAKPVLERPTEGDIINGQSPNVSGTAEPFSTVSVLVDGKAAGAATADSAGHWSLTVSLVVADGAHVLTASAQDRAGNAGPSSGDVHFTVDTHAPELTITSGPREHSRLSQVAFEFSSSKSGVTFECSLDGSSFIGCESPAVYINLHDGEHAFSVRARDIAGNVTTAGWSWTVDLGEDSRIQGGGLSCAASGDAPSFLAWLVPLMFVVLLRRRRG